MGITPGSDSPMATKYRHYRGQRLDPRSGNPFVTSSVENARLAMEKSTCRDITASAAFQIFDNRYGDNAVEMLFKPIDQAKGLVGFWVVRLGRTANGCTAGGFCAFRAHETTFSSDLSLLLVVDGFHASRCCSAAFVATGFTAPADLEGWPRLKKPYANFPSRRFDKNGWNNLERARPRTKILNCLSLLLKVAQSGRARRQINCATKVRFFLVTRRSGYSISPLKASAGHRWPFHAN